MGQIYPFGINIYPWDHTSACLGLFEPTPPTYVSIDSTERQQKFAFFSDPTHLFANVIYGWSLSIYDKFYHTIQK